MQSYAPATTDLTQGPKKPHGHSYRRPSRSRRRDLALQPANQGREAVGGRPMSDAVVGSWAPRRHPADILFMLVNEMMPHRISFTVGEVQ